MEIALLLGRFYAARRVEVRTDMVVVYKPSNSPKAHIKQPI